MKKIIKESSKRLHLVVVLRNRRKRTVQKEHENKLMLEFMEEEKMPQIKVSEKNRAMMIELLIEDEKLEQMMSVSCE